MNDQCKLIFPGYTLLRLIIKHNPFKTEIKQENSETNKDLWIDRYLIDEYIQSNKLKKESILDLCHLYDSTRHYDWTQRYVPFVQCNTQQVTTYLTLAVEPDHVLETGFFTPLNTIKIPLTHIISKTINIRCQARKFSYVTFKCISREPIIEYQLRQLIVCSLLGNYNHCNKHITSTARFLIYDAFLLDDFSKSNYLQNLLFKSNTKRDTTNPKYYLLHKFINYCSLLVINCLRDYLISEIENETALKHRLNDFMHYSEFYSIVMINMNSIRAYFNQMLSIESSALYITLTSYNELAFQTTVNEVNRILNCSHAAILKISYRRPNLDIHQFIMGMRKRHPLVKLPDKSETPKIQSIDNKNNIKNKNNIEIANNTAATINDDDSELLSIEDDEDEDEAISCLNQSHFYIKNHQLKALYEILDRCDIFKPHALLRFTEWLHFFGIDISIVEFIQTYIKHHQYSTTNTETLRLKFAVLRIFHPHAYNIIQLACEIIKRTQRHWIMFDLPGYLMKNQLNAAHSRFASLNINESSILKSNLEFVYCHVCKMIYSLLRDWKSVYKTSYKLGLRDAVVSYIDDELWCRRSKINWRGNCQKQPLTKLNLLGKILLYQGKLIMLCPQKGCCAPMVIDSIMSAFNERGIACKDCTEKLQNHSKTYEQLLLKYSCVDWSNETKPHRVCHVCQKKMEKPEDFCIFPFDTILCSVHSNLRIFYFTKEWCAKYLELANNKMDNNLKEQYQTALVDYCSRRKFITDKYAKQFQHSNLFHETKKQKL